MDIRYLMRDDATLTASMVTPGRNNASAGLSLLIAWSAEEPDRIGQQWLLSEGTPQLIGRGPAREDDPARRILPAWIRPDTIQPCDPLRSRRLSRHQLKLTRSGASLRVENLGRGALHHNGGPAQQSVDLSVGDVLEVAGQLVLLLQPAPDDTLLGAPSSHVPGGPDEHGIVGESAAAWELRRQLRFVGPRDAHVLLQGESGTGKELAARALHALSRRAGGPLVSRNAATLPEGLVDAELFGNQVNYPNHGMPARPGLIGAADQGTLFLDECAELPLPAQAHLLRVLDDGEYHRLGESSARRSDFRLVAATNRSADALKHDLLARLELRISLPSLNDRRGDIPLLVRHVLGQRLAGDPALQERFGALGGPRLSPALLVGLLRHDFTTHVRELSRLLWQAMLESPDGILRLPAVMADTTGAPSWQPWIGQPAADIPPDAVQACLDDHNGSQEQTWRALQLDSRYVLGRLIRRHGLTVTRKS